MILIFIVVKSVHFLIPCVYEMTVHYDMSGSKAAQRAFASSFMYQVLSVVPLAPCFNSQTREQISR